MTVRFFMVSALLPWVALAQSPVEVRQAFLDLAHEGVIMNLSAHPDDEDGASLAFYRMKYGVETASMFFTRGEGGQNEKGTELYEQLGVLRTAETREAALIQGTEAYFLNLMDFGYSKTATETFKKWGGRSEVLRRLVYLIRKLRPDVIFTNHATVGGHGQHQAVAIAAIDAFDAAADSTFFPEQLRMPGVAPWQPRKLFFRNFNRPEFASSGWIQSDVVNPVSEKDSVRGLSYLEIAANALRRHRTQGMERADLRAFTRGQSLHKLVRSSSLYTPDSTSFFGGIDLWTDPSLVPLRWLKKSLGALRPDMPRDSALTIALQHLPEVERMSGRADLSPLAGRVLRSWGRELQQLVRHICGVNISVVFDDSVAVPRQRVHCSIRIRSSVLPLSVGRVILSVPAGWSATEVRAAASSPAQEFDGTCAIVVGSSPRMTMPRASAQYLSMERGENVRVAVRCSIGGREFLLSESKVLDVAPPEVLVVTPLAARFDGSVPSRAVSFAYSVTNYSPGGVSGIVRARGPRGWPVSASAYSVALEDGVARGVLSISPPAGLQAGEYAVRVGTEVATSGATVRVFDVRVAPGTAVGVIKSYDNTFEEMLRSLDVPYILLNDSTLSLGDLSLFTTVLVDIRAYLVREDLRRNNHRLLAYARNGGHLLVMYQRDQEWKSEYAPYPFQISRKRIADEDAPVGILVPDHPLLNEPNRIGESDWLGWTQERAIYLPVEVAKDYVHLLSSHDPDEVPLTTGLLVAQYGRGSYLYTSYVWYRQLKELNRGAVRCFANMISYPAYRK